MKIRILMRNCASRGVHLEANEVYDLPEDEAKQLISIRRAVRLDPVIETRDPMIAIGDEAGKVFEKRRGKA